MANNYLGHRSSILEPYEGQKVHFEAIFERLGFAGEQRTLLLKDLTINGKRVNIDHLWVRLGDKTFEAYVNLITHGKQIRFNAWVQPYIHGYYSEKEFIDDRIVEFGLWRISALEVKGEDGKFKKAKISKTPVRERTLELIEKWLGYIKESDTNGYLYGRGIAIVLRNAPKVDYNLCVLDEIVGEYTTDIGAVKQVALEIYPDGKATTKQNREWQAYIKGLEKR